ncbi:MAG: hypothetical protein ACOCP4_01840 [Candidatus Woesearchaeota archaeon]
MNKYRNLLSAARKHIINFDSLILQKKSWEEINAVLILSTGRTGTKFMASYFNNYIKNFYAAHEPFPKIDLLASRYFTSKISTDSVKKKIEWRRQFIQRELYKTQQENYLESNPAFWSLIPIMREILPNIKIIHIIRDGRTWLRSAYSRKIDSKGKYKKNRHGIIWRFTADEIPTDEYYGKWSEMDIIEKLAWIWKTKNETILNDIEDDPKAITIKFEEVFSKENNYKGITDIINFINHDWTVEPTISDCSEPLKNKENKSPQFTLPKYQKLNNTQQKSFETIAGNLMEKMSYF